MGKSCVLHDKWEEADIEVLATETESQRERRTVSCEERDDRQNQKAEKAEPIQTPHSARRIRKKEKRGKG